MVKRSHQAIEVKANDAIIVETQNSVSLSAKQFLINNSIIQEGQLTPFNSTSALFI